MRSIEYHEYTITQYPDIFYDVSGLEERQYRAGGVLADGRRYGGPDGAVQYGRRLSRRQEGGAAARFRRARLRFACYPARCSGDAQYLGSAHPAVRQLVQCAVGLFEFEFFDLGF